MNMSLCQIAILNHLLNCHSHEPRCNPSASVFFSRGEHGYVATRRTSAMGLQLAYNDADNIVALIQGLFGISLMNLYSYVRNIP